MADRIGYLPERKVVTIPYAPKACNRCRHWSVAPVPAEADLYRLCDVKAKRRDEFAITAASEHCTSFASLRRRKDRP